MTQGTCPVMFAGDLVCGRKSKYANGWCNTCYNWSRTNGGADPNGRKRKRGWGDLPAELRAAANSTATRCIILTGHSYRPSVEYRGTRMAASRAVWFIANGDPGELHVLHRCHRGKEGCINIQHLYLGDRERNMRDMVEAGRSLRGERNTENVLTTTQVQEIRRLLAAGHSQRAVAAQYDVVQQTISDIHTGRNWAWLPSPTEGEDRHGMRLR